MDEKHRLNCNEVMEQLSDFLDEDARQELCKAIEEHLARCHDCQVEVDSVRKTITLYQADHAIEMPVRLSAMLDEALAREYKARSDSGDPPGSST